MYNYCKLNFRITQTKYYINEILPVYDNLTKKKNKSKAYISKVQ